MTFDPLKRDSTWRMFQPGCWIDPAGQPHIFPDEVIAELCRRNPGAGFDALSREDYDLVVRVFTEMMRCAHPEAEICRVKHVREAAS